MDRARFERLVRATALRPANVAETLRELERQARFHPAPVRNGLDELAHALFEAIAGRLDRVETALSRLCTKYAKQPLCHFYLFAVRYQFGDRAGAIESLEHHLALDPRDPLAEMLRLHFEGKPIPGITEEIRLANIRMAAATPLLRNPYQLAVGAVFEAIRNHDHARVVDVGVGSGAQMVELLEVLQRHPHRVRRLDLIGLDFVDEFLETAGRNILEKARDLDGRVAVSFHPVWGRIEQLGEGLLREITIGGEPDAVNATITLHEVPGELKVAALENLHRMNPRLLVIMEWNFFLENVLSETSLEFLFNVRQVASNWLEALRVHYSFDEVREVIRSVLTQAGGQVTCPADQRQECYLNIGCWKALLEACGFKVVPPNPGILNYADRSDVAGLGEQSWYIAAFQQNGSVPIAMVEAVPQ